PLVALTSRTRPAYGVKTGVIRSSLNATLPVVSRSIASARSVTGSTVICRICSLVVTATSGRRFSDAGVDSACGAGACRPSRPPPVNEGGANEQREQRRRNEDDALLPAKRPRPVRMRVLLASLDFMLGCFGLFNYLLHNKSPVFVAPDCCGQQRRARKQAGG